MVVSNTPKNARQGNLVWVFMLGADDKAKPMCIPKRTHL